MEDHPDFLPFDDEHNNHLIEKFKEMRAAGAHYYYDVEEFEELIDYYLFDTNQAIVNDIIILAKGQHPDSSSILLKEAETLAYSENPRRAIEIIENIPLYEDSKYEHYFSKASIYSLADQKDKAIEILVRLVEITENEDQIEAKMALAKEFQEMGDYQKSIDEYQYILSKSPDHEDALMELSLSCELSGRFDEGVKIISDFIDENPYSHFAWFSLGNMYLTLENYKEAIKSYDYATLINEDFVEAFFNLGNVFMKVERFEEAITAYKSSIIEDFADPITYNFIGHCYIVLEKNETAITFFQKAVDINPEYADGWLGYAVAYSNMNKSQEGLLYIEKAIKLNPQNMYYQYFHADLMFNLEAFEEAEVLYEKVYHSELKNSGIYMDYTETLLINNKKQQALNVLVDGISNYPDESVLYYRYSALMLEMGNEMDAESILLLALEIDPDQSSQLFNFFPEAGNFEGIMDLIDNYK